MCTSQQLYPEAIVNVVLHLISTSSSLLFITHLNKLSPWNFLTVEENICHGLNWLPYRIDFSSRVGKRSTPAVVYFLLVENTLTLILILLWTSFLGILGL